jgi:hypothetical protein
MAHSRDSRPAISAAQRRSVGGEAVKVTCAAGVDERLLAAAWLRCDVIHDVFWPPRSEWPSIARAVRRHIRVSWISGVTSSQRFALAGPPMMIVRLEIAGGAKHFSPKVVHARRISGLGKGRGGP